MKPLPDNVIQICSNQNHIIAVEEHSTYHSVGSSLLKALSLEGFGGKFKVIGIEDKFTEIVGSRDFLLKHHKIDSQSIADRVSLELGK